MKEVSYLLLLILISVKAYTQNEEYIYRNEEFGVEVKFPSKPTESTINNAYVNQVSANVNIVSAGLSYIIVVQKSSMKIDIVENFKIANIDVTITSKYKIGDKEVTEFEMHSGGACTRSKIINIKKTMIWLQVSSQLCAQDKDVLPFFNSIKVDEILIQNPVADNSKFKSYAIDYLNTKTDTVKQIVYVNTGSKSSYQYDKLSEVDKNIPQNNKTNPMRFALIIGNEDYSSHQVNLSSEINVDFARNDASAFKEYAIKVLGIPEENIIFYLDATTGQMNQGISKLNLIIKNTQGKSEIFVYYAGHGLPDEQTKEAYIMPVDVSGKNAVDGIPLIKLYTKLTEFPSKRITVFIDACFSGGARNQGLLAARGVKVKPKEGLLNGNLVVFSASTGEQSSLPLKEKHHGIFTYYLLKKIQETNGEVNYDELSKSIYENVSLQSVLSNDKEQTPQISVSSSIKDDWKLFNLR